MKKKKMMTILIILLSVGFIGTSVIGFIISRASLVKLIQTNQLPLTSDNIYSEIQRDLLQPIFISSLMANDTFLRDWVIAGEKSPEKIIRYLKEIKSKYNAFTSFFVSDKSLNYYYSDGILKKVDPGEVRDIWYFRVKKMLDQYEINVDPDMANKDTMTIFINYKVFDYDGNFIGVTGVGLNVSLVKTLIENYQTNYNCTIYFTDRKGIPVLYGSAIKDPNEITDNYKLLSLLKKIITGEVTRYSYYRNNDMVHIYARYIREFQWYLIVEQTEYDAVKGIIFALLMNILICCIISAVIISLANLTLSLYQNKIEKMAVTDELTGLYNRHIIDFSMSLALKEYERNGKNFSIILFDIDDFKYINDTFGHLAGDEVLRSIARVSTSIIRSTDILSRWGGEEFLLLINDCDVNTGFDIAEKIRNAVNNDRVHFNQNEIVYSISLGVTGNDKGDVMNDLLSRADEALYEAKRNGKNRTIRCIKE